MRKARSWRRSDSRDGWPSPGAGKRARAGIGLLAAALLVWPILAPLDGRSWREAEVFAVAPDPTAVATLGLLALAARGRWTALLGVVPALWLAVSALTLVTMGVWQGWAVLAGLLAGLAALGRSRAKTRGRPALRRATMRTLSAAESRSRRV